MSVEAEANTKALINMRGDVGDLQQKVAQQAVLVQRFDSALDKISEVSLNVSKLLAVHEQRLDMQSMDIKAIKEDGEKRREKYDVAIVSLSDKIDATDKLLRKDMLDQQKEILNEIKSMRSDMVKLGDNLEDQNRKLRHDLETDLTNEMVGINERISKLERLSWVVIGGATVIGFIISQLIGIFSLNLN